MVNKHRLSAFTRFGQFLMAMVFCCQLAAADIILVANPASELEQAFSESLVRSLKGITGQKDVLAVNPESLRKTACGESNTLVVSIGSKNAWQSQKECPNAQHLFTLLDKESLEFIHAKLDRDIVFGAVTIDPPAGITLQKASHLVTGEEELPLLVLVSENRKALYERTMPDEFRSRVRVIGVVPDKHLITVSKKALANAAALVAVPDLQVWEPKNAKWLLYLAYQRRVPVVGYSSAFTKAGAVLSVFSSQEQIVEETVVRIENWLDGGEQWRKVKSPDEYTIDINESVYKVLRLPKSNLQLLKERVK